MEELHTSRRREAAHAERVRYNKAFYSLDCDDGIEYSACLHEPSPQELMDRKELFFRLWNALNSLPEIQGRRIDAHIILGISIKAIAEADGVHEESVRQSIKRGLERMKALSIARGAGRRVRGDFSPRRMSDKHQRRRWAGPTHGHDPPLDRLAACPSGPPFPVVWGCRAEYGCLWTGQGNGRGTP